MPAVTAAAKGAHSPSRRVLDARQTIAQRSDSAMLTDQPTRKELAAQPAAEGPVCTVSVSSPRLQDTEDSKAKHAPGVAVSEPTLMAQPVPPMPERFAQPAQVEPVSDASLASQGENLAWHGLCMHGQHCQRYTACKRCKH